MLKNKLFSILFIFLGVFMFAQCPVGSINFDGTIANIASGQTYCLNSNGVTVNNLTIQPGGKLVIMPGNTLLANGSMTIAGELEIRDNAGAVLTGAVTVGTFGQPNTSIIKIGKKSFFTTTGNLTQQDPTFGGAVNLGSTATIEMDSQSVFEICGAFQQSSSTYPLINYVGAPSSLAYFIVQATSSGTGTSILSNDSQINWIQIAQSANISPGNATYCGDNATPSSCSNWPQGLVAGGCNYATDIIDNFPDSVCTKPGLAGTPTAYAKFGITTHTEKQPAWPENMPNAFIALESATNGLVITRVQNSTTILDPKEGMLIYDLDAKCIKLYNGTIWNCIKRSCND